ALGPSWSSYGFTTTPTSVAVGDFNGDGKPDVAAGDAGTNNVVVLGNDGSGSFTWITSPSSGGASPLTLAVGDFNNDGKQDLVAANYFSDTVGVLLQLPQVNEGSAFTLRGSFSDPDGSLTHTLSVNWGDGSAITTQTLAAGVLSFSGVTHSYSNSGTYPV